MFIMICLGRVAHPMMCLKRWTIRIGPATTCSAAALRTEGGRAPNASSAR